MSLRTFMIETRLKHFLTEDEVFIIEYEDLKRSLFTEQKYLQDLIKFRIRFRFKSISRGETLRKQKILSIRKRIAELRKEYNERRAKVMGRVTGMIKPMSMYFQYSGKQRPEVSAKNTFDAILSGERMATTRFPAWYNYPGGREQLELIKQMRPGTILYFRDTKYQVPESRVIQVKSLPAKISLDQGFGGSTYELTLQMMLDNPKYLERWSQLEGWSPQAGIEFFKRYGTGYQFKFEPVLN